MYNRFDRRMVLLSNRFADEDFGFFDGRRFNGDSFSTCLGANFSISDSNVKVDRVVNGMRAPVINKGPVRSRSCDHANMKKLM